MGRIGVGDCVLLLASSSPWANRPSFSSPGTGGLSRPLLSYPVALSAFFPGVRINFQYYSVALPLLGGDPCRSVGVSLLCWHLGAILPDLALCPWIHPLLTPLLLYSSAPPLRIIVIYLFWNTRWGRVASTSCRSESSNISLVVFHSRFWVRIRVWKKVPCPGVKSAPVLLGK
jgi:hypothetical protein